MFLVVRRYAPFATFGGGFEGDGRTAATTSPTATARTVGIVQFDANSVTGLKSFSSGSTFEGAGPWISSMIGRKFATVQAKVSGVQKGSGFIRFTVHTAGANPLVPVVAPDIDTFVDLTVTFGASMLFGGTVRGDNFPNAEVFVVDDGGRAAMLFDFHTGGDRNTGPTRLFGDGATQRLGTFSVTLPPVGPPVPVPVVQGV